MARRPRVFAPGLLYHVTARGNRRQATFLGARDAEAYLERLARYRARHGVSVHAYCLMPNHVHLLVETRKVSLAKFMQCLQQSYTLWFNRARTLPEDPALAASVAQALARLSRPDPGLRRLQA